MTPQRDSPVSGVEAARQPMVWSLGDNHEDKKEGGGATKSRDLLSWPPLHGQPQFIILFLLYFLRLFWAARLVESFVMPAASLSTTRPLWCANSVLPSFIYFSLSLYTKNRLPNTEPWESARGRRKTLELWLEVSVTGPCLPRVPTCGCLTLLPQLTAANRRQHATLQCLARLLVGQDDASGAYESRDGTGGGAEREKSGEKGCVELEGRLARRCTEAGCQRYYAKWLADFCWRGRAGIFLFPPTLGGGGGGPREWLLGNRNWRGGEGMVVELNRSGTSPVNADGLLPGTVKKDDYAIDYTGDRTHTHVCI